MGAEQLYLPLVHLRFNPLVEEKVQNCKPYLRALRIRASDIVTILSNPDAHWRRVVRSQGGKIKVCYSPSRELRKIQKRIIRHLRRKYRGGLFHATAFERGCSIVSNAYRHRRNRSSWRLDLAGAFEQVLTKHVYRALLRIRFEHERIAWQGVYGTFVTMDYTTDVAWLFARLLTYRGRLRLGAPSSPFTFNLLMARFDDAVGKVIRPPFSKEEEIEWVRSRTTPPRWISYTRYGDDLCFSAPNDEFPEDVKREIRELLAQHHFRVNEQKTREDRGGVMEFPGVVIVRGQIRPLAAYITKLVQRVAAGEFPASFETGTPLQLRGHYGFLGQFGRYGRRVRRRLASMIFYQKIERLHTGSSPTE